MRFRTSIVAPYLFQVNKIKGFWTVVLFDASMALSTSIPVWGFVSLAYLFMKYSWWQTHLLFDSRRRACPEYQRVALLSTQIEAAVWLNLVLRCWATAWCYILRYRRVLTAHTYQKQIDGVMMDILGEAEVGTILAVCVLGATLLSRILLVSQLKISAHVYRRREQLLKGAYEVSRDPDDDGSSAQRCKRGSDHEADPGLLKARDVWRKLQDRYPDEFRKEPPPRSSFAKNHLRVAINGLRNCHRTSYGSFRAHS